nr:MAG TPA: hypothetical protein [Bacteriophage sp.]
MAEIKVDPFHVLANREGFFLPRKNGIAFFLDGKYRYRSYSDEFRGWLDEQAGDVRRVFGNEHYAEAHSIETFMFAIGQCVFLPALVDGDLSILCRLPDQQLIDVLKQPTKEENHG